MKKTKSKKRVYISGPISGKDMEEVKKKFEEAARVITGLGYEAMSPLEVCGKERDWHRCMVNCVEALRECDAVYFLEDPCLTDSYGVMIEGLWAERLGLKRFRLEDAEETGKEAKENE